MSLISKLQETSQTLYALEWKQQEILLEAYKESLEGIRNDLRKISERYASGEVLTISEAMQEKRLKGLQQQVIQRISKLAGKGNGIITDAITQGHQQSYYRTGWACEAYTGIDFRFGKISDKQIRAALNGPVKWGPAFKTHMTKTAATINAKILTGIIQGHGYKRMNDELTGTLNMSAGKSMRILRTETHRAQVTGRTESLDEVQEAANLLNLKMVRSWLSTGDARTRESHQEMNGQVADENNLFHLPSGALTTGPGLSGIPEEDYNCRCDVVADFPELDGPAEFEPGDRIGQTPLFCLL